MSNIKKLMMSAAGGGGLDVDEVFSTYVYLGNASTQTITNDIDLSGEGGLVWVKNRQDAWHHRLTDTERGVTKALTTAQQGGTFTETNGVTAFNSNGFTLGSDNYYNRNNEDYVSWTWRKAPKFFDVVTWTGNGVNGRSISHSLGSVIGMITVKCTSTSGTDWSTWHRGASGTLWLNSTNPDSANGGGQATSGFVYNPGSNTSAFSVDGGANVNQSGRTYVAYLWAHNNGDGEFGPDGDQDIIKCGSYLNSSTAPVYIDLGWEPQWVLVRNITDASHWTIQDSMRGIVANESDNYTKSLFANSSVAESEIRAIQPTSTGFYVPNSIDGAYNSGNASGTRTHIYMAIRRGSLFPPESASEVFAVANHGTSNPAWVSGFPTDMAYGIGSSAPYSSDRLRGPKLSAMFSNAAEASNNNVTWDWQNGYHEGTSYSPKKAHMWKRAPGFFDVVTYTGNGTAGRTVSHNLGVAPEMIWVKARSAARQWVTYDVINGANGRMNLDDDGPWGQSSGEWNNTAPTASVFTVGNQYDVNSALGYKYVAYLFATLSGISKVGGYTGNGSSQTINCGFSSGAKMVLTKRTDSTGNWNVWDSERGIVAGNDPRIELNDQYGTIDTGHDYIDPHNSGFIVNYVANDADDSNVNGASYIFYAIA